MSDFCSLYDMKLSDLGEFGLIRRIQGIASRKSSSVLVGIGDDAAALRLSASQILLVTTDALLEGVHFDLTYTDFYSLGWKSAAVNLSDIAAMGGVPRFCLIALGIPARISAEQVTEFYRGFNALLRAHKTILVGGDTCSSRKGLFISVTVLGETNPRRVVTRAGARPGDRIFVTGTLGDSAAGLEILKSGGTLHSREHSLTLGAGRGQGARAGKLIQKHLLPVPRIQEGRKLALSGCASAMIDLSDGLSSDLSRICEQSKVGAKIYVGQIPLSPPLRKASARLKKTPLHYALSGGEDYELLFTVPPARVRKLRVLGIPFTEIGEITRARRMLLLDSSGDRTPMQPSGYNHFPPTSRP